MGLVVLRQFLLKRMVFVQCKLSSYLLQHMKHKWKLKLYQLRGALNIYFQIFTTILILANGMGKFGGWGWSIFLVLALVLIGIMMEGVVGVPDRGHMEKEWAMLKGIHRMSDVQVEFNDIVEDNKIFKTIKYSWCNIL